MHLTFIPARDFETTYRARWLMVSPDRIYENTCLETSRCRVTGVSKKPYAREVVDLGPGLIMPLLVNAHTHLELSALKGKVDPSKGFEAWVKDLIALRQDLGEASMVSAAREEVLQLHGQGTGAVGDISTLGLTREIMAQTKVPGIWFQEVLGSTFDPGILDSLENTLLHCPDGEPPKTIPLSISLAGHAPHTTSPAILKMIKAATRKNGLPFSIHVAESRAESDFIRGENREWTKFLNSRGIDTTHWPVGDKSPVAYLDLLGVLGPQTLGVHLIDIDENDLDTLARTGTRVCLCPRSNQALHDRLPDIKSMLDRGIAPALGTDSLASCESLSLFDEMAFIRNTYPNIAPEKVLTMAGVNGASVLGLSACLGTLEKNCWSGFLYVDLNAASCDDILESLTTYEC